MASFRSPPSDLERQQSPARIALLAVLPVFFNLRGKAVLVIGSGEPAVWKAELLAQAGAAVLVIDEDISVEMQSLAARCGLHGSIVAEKRCWSLSDFHGKALAVADVESEALAKAVVCAARSAGIPVNVIDKPAFCSFQFGSIVNRSPVVVGISTDGAAPVLGQAVRARVESVLPPSLADWAAFAKEIRAAVLNRFKPGAERRNFWARFSRLAFGPFTHKAAWGSLVDCPATKEINEITVLSVDPHDHRELTLRAIGLLQSADLIFHDRRVSPRILDLARREATRREIGEHGSIEERMQDVRQLLVPGMEKGKTILLVVPKPNSDHPEGAIWKNGKTRPEILEDMNPPQHGIPVNLMRGMAKAGPCGPGAT